jgi:hypothetical protein
MKKRRAQAFFIGTLVLTDVLMAGAAFYGAYWLRALMPFPAEAVTLAAPSAYAPVMLAHVAAVLLALAFNRLYVLARSPSRVDEFYQTIGAATTGTVTGIALSYFLFKNTPLEVDYPRAMMIYAWLLTIVLITVGRLAHGRLRAALQAQGWGRDRVLVVGTGDVARMILHKILGNPGLGYQVVGAVEVEGYPTVTLPVPILGNARDLGDLIEQHQVDEVIIALPEATHQEILTLISECERGKVTVKVFPDLFQIIAGPMGIGDLGGLPLLTVREVALRGWRRAAKRLMDVVGAAVGLIFLSPLMLLTAILIKLDSPGPAFYVQERMGLDARPFLMFKFRSMRQDAEAHGPGWTPPRRSPDHPAGQHPASSERGRVAAVNQRPAGRDEPGGAPPGAARLRGPVPPLHPPLHGPAPGESRHDRLGAGERPAGRYVHRRADQVRPLVH